MRNSTNVITVPIKLLASSSEAIDFLWANNVAVKEEIKELLKKKYTQDC